MDEERRRRHQHKPDWMDKHYSFFCNKECEMFPCHQVEDTENFNCLFCYCPLYALGDKCGGNFVYLDNGIKDCSHCLIPHKKENYGYILGKFGEIMELTMKNPEGKQNE